MNKATYEVACYTQITKDGIPCMTESSDGKWVKRSDCEELEAQVKQLSMQLELSVAAERAWEKTMMRVCGEDGPLSVAGKFNQLAAERDAVVAENAALKSMRVEGEAFENIIRMPDFTTDAMDDAAWQAYLKHCSEDDHMPFGEMYRAAVMAFRGEGFDVETPVTDAYAASLRAEGVEMAIEAAKPEVAKEFQRETFDQCVTAAVKYPQSDLSGKVEMVAWLESFSAQLRSKSEVQS